MKPSPSSDQDLAQLALTSDDESEAYWDSVRELQKRGTRAVFDMAAQLCAGDEPRSRSVGLDVLAQLGYENGRPFLAESLPIALRLARDSETTVRRSALSALGHLGDAKVLPQLLDHIGDSDPGIRLAVAQAIPSVLGDPPQNSGIAALITLSGDAASDVKDWATFGLGSLLDVDGEAIRQALTRRLDDPDGDTAGEALVGLGRRRDRGILDKVRALLVDPSVGNLVVEAAGELADPSLVSSLERLRDSGWADDDPRGWLLDEALVACREGRSLDR
jgi:HEAT repeat protein